MNRRKYIFDKESFDFKKDEKKFTGYLKTFLKYLVASLSLTVVYYVIFSIFFSTDKERSLRNENRMMEKMYPEMQQRASLLSDVVAGLKAKDDAIYEDIFQTAAPDVDRLLSVSLLPLSDTLDREGIERMTEAKVDMLLENAAVVESNMKRIFEVCSGKDFTLPPMSLPLEKFSLPMTGASVGKKINPFYKVPSDHCGIDLMASLGDRVVASAPGTVTDILRSKKGLGNVVVVEHENGYITRYAHLTDIVVSKGREVEKGTLLGHVGMTGASFAPHLHYEVLKDTLVMDPVNYFFGSLDPYQYTNMFIVSVITGQSLD